MKVGIMGFGKTGKAVATVLLESKQTTLEWVMRKSTKLSHRSVPEFLGVESDEPALIYSTAEMTADELLARHPVDAIIDFSSADGLDYYGEAVAERGVAIVSAISSYPDEKLDTLPDCPTGYFTLQDLLKPFFLLALPEDDRLDGSNPSWMRIS